jgi:hypothetical protein
VTFERFPSHAKRVKAQMCSQQCNGKARGREWGKHGAKGRANWTEASRQAVREKMSGPNNPAWKGGVTYKRPKRNYVGPRYVRCPPEFLPMARADGYIMEHRLVMAQWVGRMLDRTEVVNHRNRDPRDNRRENLELYPTNGDHKRGEVGRFVNGVRNRYFPKALARR